MARTHHLKSDVQDFSSVLHTIVWPVRENWMRPHSQPSATPFFVFFSFWMWSAVVPAGGVVPPRVLALRYPDKLRSAALPCV